MIKIKDQNRFHDNNASAFTRLFRHSEKKLLMPKKLNLVKFRGDKSILNNRNFRIGDRRIGLLAKSLNRANHLRKLNLSGNRLTENGAVKLISTLTKAVTDMDLSYNKIGKIGANYLCEYLESYVSKFDFYILLYNIY